MRKWLIGVRWWSTEGGEFRAVSVVDGRDVLEAVESVKVEYALVDDVARCEVELCELLKVARSFRTGLRVRGNPGCKDGTVVT